MTRFNNLNSKQAMRRQSPLLDVQPIPAIETEKLFGIFQSFTENIHQRLNSSPATGPLSALHKSFARFLLERICEADFRALQLHHLTTGFGELPRNELKYLDTGHWAFAKLNTAFRLGLHDHPPIRILDIGTGPGHFQLAAEFLGHETHGLDIPLVARDGARTHLYDDLCELWGLDRTTHRIEAQHKLPDLGMKFDLVTAFMICFSGNRGEVWSPDDWRYFFRDLVDNHLRPGGHFVGTMTRGSITEESWAFIKAHASEWNDANYFFRLDEFAFLKASIPPRPVQNPYSALAKGDLEGALEWFDRHRDGQLLKSRPRADLAIRTNAAARSNLEVGLILDHWMSDEELSPLMVGQFVIQRLKNGAKLDEAVAALPDAQRLKYGDLLKLVFQEFSPERRLAASRHLAICGVSFCGSTLIERILGGIRGAASIGESVYLTHHHGKDGNRPVAIETLDFSRTNKCGLCGADCEYLTPRFRAALGLNPIDWYQQIADRLQADLLISSDKNLPKIIRHDPLLRLDALVIFKSPEQAWYSNFAKLPGDLGEDEISEKMENYLTIWHDRYAELLHDFSPRGQVTFLDFDAFTHTPEAVLTGAMQQLAIDFDQKLLDRVVPSHSIGGNGMAVRKLRTHDFKVRIEARSDSLLPPAHLDWIKKQDHLNDLHAALREATRA